MKCPTCGGSIIHDPGDCYYPARYYCISCGREPREKGGENMDEMKKCLVCGTEFKPKRRDSKCCSKKCNDKFGRDKRANKKPDMRFKESRKESNPIAKPVTEKPAPPPDGILLDSQLIKAVKQSVAREIIKYIEERFV
jgi:predicted nucleic acid-binding Zn ribbon protein